MTNKKILLLPLFILVTLPALISCGEDRWPEFAARTVPERWIDSIMRTNYLWYSQMPNSDKLNYFKDTESFLKSAIVSADKNYSWIDSLANRLPHPSYGFEYTLIRASANDTAFNALITYLLPESPAAAAGLQRGDWIMKVNNEYITKKSETRLLGGTAALHLQLGKYTETLNENETLTGTVVENGSTDMSAARVVENNPIHYVNTYTVGGKKVGYLVYSHFTSGPFGEPEKYDNQLRTLSRTFKDEGINTLILDMRYNTGGETAVAQLLSTILTPATKLNTPMAYLEYNDKQTETTKELYFNTELLNNGANLNTVQLIVLTTSVTAGAAETVINCLKPYIPTIIIGQTTVGQNVGTQFYPYPNDVWGMHLVEYTIYNGEKKSDYTSGFTPTYSLNEMNFLLHFLPFGDVDETLLSAALAVLAGTYTTE